MKLCGLALTVVLVCPVLAFAQHEQHGAGAEKLGTVNFETSCKAETRADFNRAVALLHSFEYRPAIEGFQKVLAADATCATAYWGIAVAQWGNPFGGIKTGPLLERGRDAVQKGLSTGSPTPRERAYISAIGELYKDAATVPHRDRTLAYAKAMEALQRDNPKDVEARIFYALAMNQTALATDKTYAAQLQAAQILEPLWKQYPDHPGLPHYIIHAYDHPPLAPKALEAARKYATIAPSAPHALHMPSHTFTRVGYWKDSVETNIKSEQTALKQNVIGEALHALDYQAYAYLQMAQDQKAKAVLDRLGPTAAKLDLNAIGGAAAPVAGLYARSAVPRSLCVGTWDVGRSCGAPGATVAVPARRCHHALCARDWPGALRKTCRGQGRGREARLAARCLGRRQGRVLDGDRRYSAAERRWRGSRSPKAGKMKAST